MTLAWTPRTVSLALGALSALALAVALASQYGFGMAPCDLCVMQRWWHGAVAAAALLTLLFGRPRLLLNVQTAALLICCGFAAFHAGVEQHWWRGPSACTARAGAGAASLEDLKQQILATLVVRCDEIRAKLLGLSMATWNAGLTAAMAAFAIVTLARKP